jgi:hypothetical protein
MPDMNPPAAPANAWKAVSDLSIINLSQAVVGTLSSLLGGGALEKC